MNLSSDDGVYRTVLFAREPGRDVVITAAGKTGVKIETPEYSDYVFLGDEWVEEECDEIQFSGRAGWIRRETNGTVQTALPDGECIRYHC